MGESNNTRSRGCCCNSASSCCSSSNDKKQEGVETEKRKLNIDFMYLDLAVCGPCRGTDKSLEEAVSEVAHVLRAANIEVVVNKINVTSEEQAKELGFISSPTISVNGHDIQLDVKESLCESCEELCGDNVDCRVWVYQGKEYTVPPKAMIIEAILKEVYGKNNGYPAAVGKIQDIPDNLKRFFAARSKKML